MGFEAQQGKRQLLTVYYHWLSTTIYPFLCQAGSKPMPFLMPVIIQPLGIYGARPTPQELTSFKRTKESAFSCVSASSKRPLKFIQRLIPVSHRNILSSKLLLATGLIATASFKRLFSHCLL